MSTSSARSRCQIDLFSPTSVADPYPIYRYLRETTPVCWIAQGFWITTRYADAVLLLNDSRCDHWGHDTNTFAAKSSVEAALSRCLRLLSPVQPTPFRRAAFQAIITQMTETAADENARHADAILAAIAGRDRFDVIADYAHPFTMGAVCRLMGLSEAESTMLDAIIKVLPGGVLRGLSLPANDRADYQDPATTLRRFLSKVIADRRCHPLGDLTSQLIADGSLSKETPDGERQLINLLILLFHAGHQNMMNFIGNALLALVSHQDSLVAARLSPALLATGIEELLRYDSPVQYIPLVAREAIKLADQLIEPGEQVWVGIGAANRDPEAFNSPDTLDLRRHAHRHLAFGHGSWRCIGARLAQIQGAIALQRFIAHVSDFRVADVPLRWRNAPVVQRGLYALPLEGVRYA